ncbi:MAG: GntR family transcriptional regulator [Spirochaetes bacterium]|nr:GntR family transcriptional regulator [Spirochaetota bacterium]
MEYNSNIDRKSFKPAYIQLVNILRSQIDSGKFRPGGRLPSESQLCKSYNVSPMTVRRAINILLQEGVVSTTQGRGTFVKAIELHSVKFGSRELQDIFSGNIDTKVKLLEVKIIKANADIALKLNIKPDTRVILIRRLIMKDMEPVFYHQEYLIYNPTHPTVESEMGVTALYGLFTGRGEASLKRGEISIKPAILSETEAHLLLVDTSLPSFRLEHIFFDFDNRPISWGYFLCRSDKISFNTRVGSGETSDIILENQ